MQRSHRKLTDGQVRGGKLPCPGLFIMVVHYSLNFLSLWQFYRNALVQRFEMAVMRPRLALVFGDSCRPPLTLQAKINFSAGRWLLDDEPINDDQLEFTGYRGYFR